MRVIALFLTLLPFLGTSQSYVPGQIIVKLPSGVGIERLMSQYADEGGVARFTSAKQISKVLNAWLVSYEADVASDEEVLRDVERSSFVQIAQFNHYVYSRTEPNDPLFSSQWNLKNTGQSGGTPDADIDAEEAWSITTGGLTALGDTIVVAVIDGGVDLNHEDMQGNLWRNYADPHNGNDDDSNGYVDDYFGWDFYFNNDNISADYHGTPVASIIGARGNNSVGIAGINWRVKIMAVGGPENLGNPNLALAEAGVIEAYSYVLAFRKKYNATNGAEGAFVVAVNSSWGLDKEDPANAPLWCAMYDSMGAAGIVNCAATANGNWDVDDEGDLPTGCASDYLISVTNTDKHDVKVFWAAYGDTSVDLGAPGEDALAAYPGPTYNGFGGTSGATPHVTGTVALLYATTCLEFAQFAKADPAGAALAVTQFILDGVDPITDLQNRTTTGGRLNVYNSLMLAENYGNCALGIEEIATGGISGLSPNPADNYVEVAFTLDISQDVQVVICDILGRVIRIYDVNAHIGKNALVMDLATYSPGVYFVYLSGGLNQSQHHKLVVH